MSRTRPPAGTARQPGSHALRPHDTRADETPAAVGNHAMTRLLATGPGVLRAHPAIAGLAGNRAVQRLVAPVQRTEGQDDEAPQPTGGYIQQTHAAGTRTGPLPEANNDGRPPLVPPEPVQMPMPGAHREVDPNRGKGAWDPHPVDSQYFKKGTTLNDGVSAVSGTGGAADFIGLSDHALGTQIAGWSEKRSARPSYRVPHCSPAAPASSRASPERMRTSSERTRCATRPRWRAVGARTS